MIECFRVWYLTRCPKKTRYEALFYKRDPDDQEFRSTVSDAMCSDWNKDYENEFWTSKDPAVRENAYELSGEKALKNLMELPFADKLVLMSINLGCRVRQHNIETCRELCEIARDNVMIEFDKAAKTIQKMVNHVLYKDVDIARRLRQGEMWIY